MDEQKDLNASMRSALVNWLVRVHDKFRLRPTVLYLAVSIVDRFLSEHQTPRSKLELLGCVALFIASKLEMSDPPVAQDFIDVAGNIFTPEEMFLMEGVRNVVFWIFALHVDGVLLRGLLLVFRASTFFAFHLAIVYDDR